MRQLGTARVLAGGGGDVLGGGTVVVGGGVVVLGGPVVFVVGEGEGGGGGGCKGSTPRQCARRNSRMSASRNGWLYMGDIITVKKMKRLRTKHHSIIGEQLR